MFSVYHLAVIDEIAGRKNTDNLKYWFTNWQIYNYRGPHLGFDTPDDRKFREIKAECDGRGFVYKEHDDMFLLEDVRRLAAGKDSLVNGVSEEAIMLELAAKGVT